MNIEKFAKETLTEPGSFMTSAKWAYTTHGCTIARSRDSDVLGISNWETIKDDMMERFPDDCEILSCSHWAVGWTEELFVRVYKDDDPEAGFTEAFEAIHDWHDRLSGYPVADEEDLFEREYKDLLETLKACYDVPEDKLDEVVQYLFEGGDVSRSEDLYDRQVAEAMVEVGIDRDDIPSWLLKSLEPKEEGPRPASPGVASVQMGTMDSHGHMVEQRTINANACPHMIFTLEHYREDGTCRCDDPDHGLFMIPAGYRWNDNARRWM